MCDSNKKYDIDNESKYDNMRRNISTMSASDEGIKDDKTIKSESAPVPTVDDVEIRRSRRAINQRVVMSAIGNHMHRHHVLVMPEVIMMLVLLLFVGITAVACGDYKNRYDDTITITAKMGGILTSDANGNETGIAKSTDARVNVYLFWGDGCGYCKKECEFLSKFDVEHRGVMRLIEFETWNDKSNELLAERCGESLGTKGDRVPLAIVGGQAFQGYDNNVAEKLADAILDEYKKSEWERTDAMIGLLHDASDENENSENATNEKSRN